MILNLTQHDATPDQLRAGVCDIFNADRAKLLPMLTFDGAVPSRATIADRAAEIAALAVRIFENARTPGVVEPQRQAMIGGALFLMSALERALTNRRIQPVYAFSRRESVEEKQADGSTKKVSVFRHIDFVKMPM